MKINIGFRVVASFMIVVCCHIFLDSLRLPPGFFWFSFIFAIGIALYIGALRSSRIAILLSAFLTFVLIFLYQMRICACINPYSLERFINFSSWLKPPAVVPGIIYFCFAFHHLLRNARKDING